VIAVTTDDLRSSLLREPSYLYSTMAAKDTGVTATCLMPGAKETDFFERADTLDAKVGLAGAAAEQHRRMAAAGTAVR